MPCSVHAGLWATVLLASSVLAASTTLAAEARFEQRDGVWFCIDQDQAFRVNDIVSVRLDGDLAPFLESLRHPRVDPTPVDLALAALTPVRSNRLGIHDLRIPAGANPIEIAQVLSGKRGVQYAEPNHFGIWVGAVDPDYINQYALHNSGQTGGTPDADIDAPEAWAIQSGDPSIVIAVIDSGTEIDHPDLIDLMWKNENDIPANGLDDDLNGFTDDYDGWDFASGNNDPTGTFYHGTFVTGIIAARRNNGIGMAGIAGGDGTTGGCRVMPLGVGDSAPSSDVLDDAILYAADNGARIITLSLSVDETSAINDAIIEAHDVMDIFIDCAVGNWRVEVGYPARLPQVMAVASTDHDDLVPTFSSPGPEVEIAAPGNDIWSTTIGGTYTISSGTSFSAPLVAGVAGLMLSERPCLSAEDLRRLLRDTANDIAAPGEDIQSGSGRVNAAAAVTAASVDLCMGDPCRADLDDSGDIGFADLVAVLATWGGCPDCPQDFDYDGTVGFSDLLFLLASWGPCS